MLKLDKDLISDRLTGTSYSFYTDEEIMRLSVKNILNPTAFDQLGKPLPGGLYDRALGVSPFDARSTCITCGLDCNHCPGHVGHIDLVVPVYNPFLVNQVYKLLKSKCLHCNRLRIPVKKIDIFTMSLKLIKSGQVVHSQTVKAHFMNAAKEVQLLNDQQKLDPKKLEHLARKLDDLLSSRKKDEQVERGDLQHYFRRLDKTFNKKKKAYQQNLIELLNEFTTHHKEEPLLTPSQQTSIMQKSLKTIFQEIWASVVTTTCPHCQGKSPGFRKDGYTKIFQRPLSEKMRNAMVQQERIQGGSSRKASASAKSQGEGDGFEIATELSTRQHTNSMGSALDDENQHSQSEEEDDEISLDQQKMLSAIEVRDHIDRLWRAEGELLNLMYGRYYPVVAGEPYVSDSLGPKMFFLNKLIVPPTRFRPESQGGFGGGGAGDKAFLHAHSAMLSKVLNLNLQLKDALLSQQNSTLQTEAPSKKSVQGDIIQKWLQLQDAINVFMDSSTAQKTADKEQNGLRQLLERKEGMFRMKMMGKRVNFGARSVISPDPYITTDQIGVPIFMAKKLTFPESVSEVNVERLRKAVINGPKVHPGANIVEDQETGTKQHLETLSVDQRRGIAYQLTVGKKIVYRHMTNGDVLLVNRQPTLHKPSIMAHIARVLPKEQTIRMHYANCNTYNADFDGDEMNLHLCQSYLACSEAYKLMATHKQYIVPTSGKPIRGLIQDSVVSGVFMSSKDTFLNKEQYQQLVYVGLRELLENDQLPKITTMSPTIIKPQPLWTGKQVISTILKNIVNQEGEEFKKRKVQGLNLDSKSKLPASEWGPLGKEEGDVIFRDNELLQGTIDKNQFGASEFGLVHSFYELYGSEKAGELLTALARIFAAFLQMHGFTCGLDDLVLTPEYNKKRRMIIEECHQAGMNAAAEFGGLKGFKSEMYNYSNRIVFQGKGKKKDKEIEKLNKMALPENPFEGKKCVQVENPVRTSIESKFNTSEDVQKLDQEYDNAMRSKMNDATGKVLKTCAPDGLMKRFPKNNISAMVLTGAKGGVVNMTQISCLLGQQELEGRRVPKMQNGKTLPCYLPYDPNPRSSGYVTDRFISGLRPQDFYFHCMAGREGLIDTAVKTSRSGYLQRCLIKQLESLIVNYDMTVRDNDGSIIQFLYGDDGIDVMNSKYLDRFQFLEQNFSSILANSNGHDILQRVDQVSVDQYKHDIRNNMKRIKKEFPQITKQELYKNHKGDPVISKFHPQRYFGAISEKIEDQLKGYIEKDSYMTKLESLGDKVLKQKYKPIKSEAFQKTYFLKYMQSVAHAGENVGTIAGQSVGEPSTQMTLNTFHLAGHGAGNVTLGIPRLKEILMTTPNNIKTPYMTVQFRKESLVKMNHQQMEQFANKFKRIRLSDVTKEVKVSQYIASDSQGQSFSRVYKITLLFESFENIKNLLGLSFEEILRVFSDKYVTLLLSEISKQLKKSTATSGFVRNGGAGGSENGEDDVNTVGGTHKTATSQKRGGKKANSDAELALKNGDEQQFIEEEENAIKNGKKKPAKKDDDDDDEDNESEFNEDIDGVQKKTKEMRSYEQIDEGANDEPMEYADEGINEDDLIQQHCNVFKEKFQKYLSVIKGITQEKEKSVTIELSYNLQDKKILMLTLAENLLSKVLVRSVQGIDKCILVIPEEKEKKDPYLYIQGLNFKALYEYSEVVDVNKIKTNDIYKMMKQYGVEAGRANLVEEVRSVFKMYGIEVNYRHLSMIGDFMTFNGDYRAFNRVGMEESSSPFLKMSFETTMKYLVASCLGKETDDMSTPSSALVLGQVPRVGTGVFDIIHDTDAQAKLLATA